MSSYWVQFARTGDPNAAGLPRWEPYTATEPRVLEIGDEQTGQDVGVGLVRP